MTTPRIQRFDFNSLRDFRGPIVMQTVVDNAATEAPPPPPPPPTFTAEDIETARLAGRKQGYGEGFIAGQTEALRQAEAKAEQASTALTQLGEMLADLSARYQQLLQEESTALGQLVVAIARKVAGEALDARGEQTMLAIVERTLPVMFSKPRLIVELHPEMFDAVIDRVEHQLRACGFEGEVQFKGNPEFSPSDITLDWGTGQLQRNTTTLWQEVEALMERVPLEITFHETLETNNQQN